MLIAGVISFILFYVAPVIYVFVLAFTQTDFISWSFVGFDNFRRVLESSLFQTSLFNTVIFSIMMPAGVLVTSINIVLWTYRCTPGQKDAIKAAVYIPSIVSTVVIVAIVKAIFKPGGLVTALTGSTANILGSRLPVMMIVSGCMIYMVFGAYAILLYAIMDNTDKEVIEAARIDGASNVRIRYQIMLPILWHGIREITTIVMFGAFFVIELFFLLSPPRETYNFMAMIYNSAFMMGDYGYSAAATIYLMIIIAVFYAIKKRFI